MYEVSTVYQEQMASSNSTITVVDVYDIAAAIGKEFEGLIDGYGPEAVTELMPRVILVLEQLEVLASKNQKENQEITELRMAVERLEAEKATKAAERLKYEKELEELEESWRQETSELLDTVTKLQEDNRKLRGALSEQEGHTTELQRKEEEELKIITKLKTTSNKQRDQIRTLQHDLSQKNMDVEAMRECLVELEDRLNMVTRDHQLATAERTFDIRSMQSQLERLARLNVDYRRKTTLTQRQASHLVQEKADLQAQLQDKEQQIQHIKDHMRDQDSLDGLPASPLSDDDFDRMEERLCLEGKMVIDMKDPNRPRFTLNELRDVLQERNELKTKLIEVEEELQTYRPKSEDEPEDEPEPGPVQGPINKEPWDKLYPGQKSDSQIRRFFKFFFGESGKEGQKGRRPSQTRKKVVRPR